MIIPIQPTLHSHLERFTNSLMKIVLWKVGKFFKMYENSFEAIILSVQSTKFLSLTLLYVQYLLNEIFPLETIKMSKKTQKQERESTWKSFLPFFDL